jgi:UDP-N-acetylmuramoyl-L-alanyl-D-glutamate--2,6-diaminopimelate ligase
LKKTINILDGIQIVEQIGSIDKVVGDICFDSRKAGLNTMFVAMHGTMTDGHKYLGQVAKQGASVIVCEEMPQDISETCTYVKVKSSKQALAKIASNFYGNPSSKLKLIGATGTNGKTTIVTLLHKLFQQLGYHVGMLSTIQNKIDERIIPSTHTTPDPIQINALLKEMVDAGCSHCFMEVSSHAIDQGRTSELGFCGGIFTNLTHDHLDYHKDFASYLKAKKTFFDQLPGSAFALTNLDDKNGSTMLQNTKAKKYTYALLHPADFKARILDNQFEGLQLQIDNEEVWMLLSGKFNAYNLLSVYGTAMLLGEDKIKTLAKLSQLEGAEGRMEFIRSQNNITAIVDYAHTPDALKNILETINEIRTGNEQLISVVGAGGDRDKSKRPLMAQIAARLSNKIILTSDNPRSEDPEKIINEMIEGIDGVDYKKMLALSMRKEAIKTACMLAQPKDIILVAGKGHEKYQEINGIKHPFDDRQILIECLNLKTEAN